MPSSPGMKKDSCVCRKQVDIINMLAKYSLDKKQFLSFYRRQKDECIRECSLNWGLEIWRTSLHYYYLPRVHNTFKNDTSSGSGAI